MKICRPIQIAAFLIVSSYAVSAVTLTQCPPATITGSTYTGCNFLITQNADNSFTTAVDTTQPFFGGEDNYGGFQNNTSHSVSSLVINGQGTTLFAFDGDGPTAITAATPTGYEGPNNTFGSISSDYTTGTVLFTTPIAPGASEYFYLEEAVNPSKPPVGGNTPEPATLGLMGTSLLGFGCYALRRKRVKL